MFCRTSGDFVVQIIPVLETAIHCPPLERSLRNINQIYCFFQSRRMRVSLSLMSPFNGFAPVAHVQESAVDEQGSVDRTTLSVFAAEGQWPERM